MSDANGATGALPLPSGEEAASTPPKSAAPTTGKKYRINRVASSPGGRSLTQSNLNFFVRVGDPSPRLPPPFQEPSAAPDSVPAPPAQNGANSTSAPADHDKENLPPLEATPPSQSTQPIDGPSQEMEVDLRPAPRWKGLDNYGNTCYVNVIVQALFFCPGFRVSLDQFVELATKKLSDEEQQHIRRKPPAGNGLMGALNALLQAMAAPQTQNLTAQLTNFLREMRSRDKRFQGTRQQDAQEFLNFLLLSLHKTALEILRPPKPEMTVDHSSESEEEEKEAEGEAGQEGATKKRRVDEEEEAKAKAEAEAEKERAAAETAPEKQKKEEEEKQKALPEKSFISEMFEGKLELRIKCLECEGATAKPEPFMDLSLSMLGDAHPPDLDTLLRDYFVRETMRGRDKFFCDTCHTKAEAHRGYVVGELPYVFTLHLKRFAYEGQRKICRHFPPPFETTFADYSKSTDDRRYRLFAVVFHAGYYSNSGHYRCVVREPDTDAWVLIDDEDVAPLSREELLKMCAVDSESINTAYILLYHQISHPTFSSLPVAPPLVSQDTIRMPSLSDIASAAALEATQPMNEG